MICENCGTKMVLETGTVYTSQPPMFKFVCPKCGVAEFSHTLETESDEQPPVMEADMQVLRFRHELEQCMNVKLHPLVRQMTKLLGDAYEAGFDFGLSCGKKLSDNIPHT